MDTKLNISPMYMKPGFAFGGSCLPKDLRAVVAESRHRGLPLPVIQNILPSNKAHLESCIEHVLNIGERAIGLFGLTFKEGTDDLRESPAVELAERLIGKGMDVTIYEPAISRETIHGTNLSFIERNIPHVWKLLTNNLETMVQEARVIVVLKKMNDQERHILQNLKADQVCMDLTGTIKLGELKSQILKLGTPSSEVVLL
jgi:GDP-mannose 6-dehydrogenase